MKMTAATTPSGTILESRKLRGSAERRGKMSALDHAVDELNDRPEDALDDAERSLQQREEELQGSARHLTAWIDARRRCP